MSRPRLSLHPERGGLRGLERAAGPPGGDVTELVRVELDPQALFEEPLF